MLPECTERQAKRRREALGVRRPGDFRKQWTAADDETLRRLNAAGKSPAEMMSVLERSECAIRRRRETLGLPAPSRREFARVRDTLREAGRVARAKARVEERRAPRSIKPVLDIDRVRAARAQAEAATMAARERYRLDEPPLWERL